MPFDNTTTFVETAPHQFAAEIAIVTEMQRLLATPDKWCQRQAIGANGSMCLTGAMHRACDGRLGRGLAVIRKIEAVAGLRPVVYNDTHTHADVLDLLARVKALFEREGA